MHAWTMMGGTLDWAALPVVVEILGVRDPETLIAQLLVLRSRRRLER